MAVSSSSKDQDKGKGSAEQPKQPARGEVQTDPEPQPEDVRTPLDPYPDYDAMELSELRSLAKDKGVGVPADVEKAALVAHLRRNPPEDVSKHEGVDGIPSYDLLTVEDLRGLLADGDSVLSKDEERAYLVGQLRAVASGPTSAQSAQLGSNRPAESLPAPSGVSDKDQGRG